jgi:hypothetical protein
MMRMINVTAGKWERVERSISVTVEITSTAWKGPHLLFGRAGGNKCRADSRHRAAIRPFRPIHSKLSSEPVD